MTDFVFPEPRRIDPTSIPALRWGVLGPGGIASTWVGALHRNTPHRVVAAASATSRPRAEKFAAEFGIATVADSYAELCALSEVDAVYVATLHRDHLAAALAAIDAGKPVLVEKPIAVTPAEAELLRARAESAGVLVMEALWTAYLPHTDVMRQLLADGVIGDIDGVTAELGLDLRGVPRLDDPIDGGALLDVGIYPLSFITALFDDAPLSVDVLGSADANHLDVESVLSLRYPNGVVGNALSSRRAFTQSGAWIGGSNASLEIHGPHLAPTRLTLRERTFNSTPIATWAEPNAVVAHEGLFYETLAFARYLGEGRTDSPIRPLAKAITDVSILDTARRTLGWSEPV